MIFAICSWSFTRRELASSCWWARCSVPWSSACDQGARRLGRSGRGQCKARLCRAGRFRGPTWPTARHCGCKGARREVASPKKNAEPSNSRSAQRQAIGSNAKRSVRRALSGAAHAGGKSPATVDDFVPEYGRAANGLHMV